MKCVIVGHSHLLSLQMALAKREKGKARAADVSFECLRIEPSPRLDVPDLMSRLDSSLSADSEAKVVVVMLGGNEHNVLGMLTPCPLFDLFLPGDEAGGDGAAVDESIPTVTYGAVREQLAGMMRYWTDALHVLAKLPHPCVYLQPPRPIFSSDFIHRHLDKGFGVIADVSSISPPALRLKLWRCMDDVIRDACAKAGMLFLPHPKEAVSDHGFLAEEAWWIDATHANDWYGELCLQAIAAFARQAMREVVS